MEASAYLASTSVLPEPLLTSREVANWLGVGHHCVLDWWQAGKIPGYKLAGKAVRFSRDEIAAWLEEQRQDHLTP
jgi:excisionase family DNA binding protein